MKEAKLEGIVERCASQKINIRVSAYRILAQKCMSESEEVIWSNYASLDDTQKTLSNLKTDLFSKTEEISHEAATVCGCLLANDTFLTLVNPKDKIDILCVLIKLMRETKENKLLAGVLMCVARSKLGEELYQKKDVEILEAALVVLKNDDSSVDVVHEALALIQVMLVVATDGIMKLLSNWFVTVFERMFHSTAKVRAMALSVVNQTVDLLREPSHSSLRKSIITSVIQGLRNKHAKEMFRLLSDESSDILEVWKMVVRLLGKDLHSGTTLINALLEVVEKAFKSSKSEIRTDAFKCWQALIDNFSLDVEVLSNTKRLKLLLAPLKVQNTKTEDVAQAKLLTWWHLVFVLSKTSTVSIEMVVAPLLRFCFNCGSSPGGSMAGLAERNLIMSGAAASPGRKFCGLHVMCAEILAQILATGSNCAYSQAYKFSVKVLEKPIISSPTLYIRHHALFLSCFSESVKTLSATVLNQHLLGILIFDYILKHTQTVIALDTQKKESVDAIKELFITLSGLEKHSLPGDSQSSFIFKFLELVTVGSQALPVSVLNSRQYHIASGGTMGDMISGTLSNHLVHQLCKPTLLHHATLKEQDFMRIWSKILGNSKPVTGKLGFLQSAMREVDSAAPVLCPTHPSTLVRLWSAIVQELVHFIEETQVIDQSDGSENDWSCIYTVLLFPLKHSFEALSSLEAQECTSIVEWWTKLWMKFTELSQLSATAEANSEIEELGRVLLGFFQDRPPVPPDLHVTAILLAAHVLAILTQTLRYSELGKTPPKMFSSPAKPKKKPHPLHNLAACVDLFSLLFDRVLRMVSSQRQQSAHRLCVSATHMISNIYQAKTVYINEFIKHLVEPLILTLEVNPAAKFNSMVEKRVVSMLAQYWSLVESQYGKKHSGEQLTRMLPLLKVAISSSNEGIQSEAVKLWRNCFASTKVPLPSSFMSVLKSHSLPPASLIELEENVFSPSSKSVPAVQRGSAFLREARAKITPNKANSPKLGPSAKSPGMSGPKAGLKFNTSLEDMNDEDFVKIASPSSSGRRVLTEHQKERMRERRHDIPALYSDLSQASQLTSQLTYDGSIEKSVDQPLGKSVEAEKNIFTEPPPQTMQRMTNKNTSFTMSDNLSFTGKLSTFRAAQKENVPEDNNDIVEDVTEADTSASKSDNGEVLDKISVKRRTSERKTNNSEDSVKASEKASLEKSETSEKESDFNKLKGQEMNSLEIATPNTKKKDDKEVNSSVRETPRTKKKDDQEIISLETPKTRKKDDKEVSSVVKETPKTQKNEDKEAYSSAKETPKTSRDQDKEANSLVKDTPKTKKTDGKEINDTPMTRNDQDILLVLSDVYNNSPGLFKTYPGKKKKQEVSPRRYGNGESDYTDEELDEELRKTSIELQRSLEISADSETNTTLNDTTSATLEIHRRKSQTPLKKTISDVRRSLRGNSTSRKSTEDADKVEQVSLPAKLKSKPRISFREVAVSPSIIKDDKLVKQVPEVKLKTDKQIRNTSTVCETDSEDEIPDSQPSEEISSKSPFSTNLPTRLNCNNSKDGQVTTVKRGRGRLRSKKSLEDPNNLNSDKRGPGRSKSKRSLEDPVNSDSNNPSKKKKSMDSTGTITQKPTEMKQNSSDESIIVVEEIKKLEKLKNQIKSTDLKEQHKSEKALSESGSDLEEYQEDSEPRQITPQKVTRSGRKIVAPKRDMPEPMTPPGVSNSKRRKSQENAVPTNDSDSEPNNHEDFPTEVKDKSARKSLQMKMTDIFYLEPKKSSENESSSGNLPEMEDMDDDAYGGMEDYEPDQLESSSESPLKETDEVVDNLLRSKIDNVKNKIMNESNQSVILDEGNNSVILDEGNKSVILDEGNKSVILDESNMSVVLDKDDKNNDEEHNDKKDELAKEADQSSSSSIEPPNREEIEDTVSPDNQDVAVNTNSTNTERESNSSKHDHTLDNLPGESIDDSDKVLPNQDDDETVDKVMTNNVDKVTKNNAEKVTKNNADEVLERKQSQVTEKDTDSLRKEDKPTNDKSILECEEEPREVEEFIDVVCSEEEGVDKSKNTITEEKSKTTSTGEETKPTKNLTNKEIPVADEDSELVSPVRENEKSIEENKSITNSKESDRNKNPNNQNESKEKLIEPEDQQEGMEVESVDPSITIVEDVESSPIKQQHQEELSPEKSDKSKFKSAVSTPERLKKKGSLKYAGSRAAMLVACAKQNIKNRGESPTKAQNGVDEGRRGESGFSPGCRSVPSKISPSSTPSRRKRKFHESDGGRPWAKHEPSPGASPSSSILKKSINNEQTETPSPPLSKYRRVSFADPPVSDKVEIPPSPKSLKSIKAQKRLDMTNASSSLKDNDFPSSSVESQEIDSPVMLDCSQPLYPALTGCGDKLDTILHHLTSPPLTDGLKAVLRGLGVHTVGQLSQLTEADVSKLPVRAPKISATIQALKKHEETLVRVDKTNEQTVDNVEAQMFEMFGGLDREDKENLRPNRQDRTRKSFESEREIETEAEREIEVEGEIEAERELETTDEREMVNVDKGQVQEEKAEVVVDEVEGVCPLDTSFEDMDQRVRERVRENPELVNQVDLQTKETLFSILLDKLPYRSVIDKFHQYLSRKDAS